MQSLQAFRSTSTEPKSCATNDAQWRPMTVVRARQMHVWDDRAKSTTKWVISILYQLWWIQGVIGLCTLRTYPCHKEKHDKARLLARCGEYKARVSPFRRLQRRDTSGTDMSVISVPGVLARQPFRRLPCSRCCTKAMTQAFPKKPSSWSRWLWSKVKARFGLRGGETTSASGGT